MHKCIRLSVYLCVHSSLFVDAHSITMTSDGMSRSLAVERQCRVVIANAHRPGDWHTCQGFGPECPSKLQGGVMARQQEVIVQDCGFSRSVLVPLGGDWGETCTPLTPVWCIRSSYHGVYSSEHNAVSMQRRREGRRGGTQSLVHWMPGGDNGIMVTVVRVEDSCGALAVEI